MSLVHYMLCAAWQYHDPESRLLLIKHNISLISDYKITINQIKFKTCAYPTMQTASSVQLLIVRNMFCKGSFVLLIVPATNW